MDIQRLTAEQALTTLQSSTAGLTASEADRRLREFGANRIESLRAEPQLVRFLKQLTHLFAVILWIAASLALIAGIANPGQGMGTLAVAVVAVILINAIFSHWQEYRAEQAVAALQALLPHDVRAVRNGRVRIILKAVASSTTFASS